MNPMNAAAVSSSIVPPLPLALIPSSPLSLCACGVNTIGTNPNPNPSPNPRFYSYSFQAPLYAEAAAAASTSSSTTITTTLNNQKISLYFRQLLFVGIAFLIAGLIYLPTILHNKTVQGTISTSSDALAAGTAWEATQNNLAFGLV